MMIKKTYMLFLGLATLITACAPTSSDPLNAYFRITNHSSTLISAEYVAYTTNDTSAVQIDTSNYNIVWEVPIPNTDNGNWYYIYGIEIINLTNQVGDTVNFNPNVCSYWQQSNYSYSHPYDRQYELLIEDTSF